MAPDDKQHQATFGILFDFCLSCSSTLMHVRIPPGLVQTQTARTHSVRVRRSQRIHISSHFSGRRLCRSRDHSLRIVLATCGFLQAVWCFLLLQSLLLKSFSMPTTNTIFFFPCLILLFKTVPRTSCFKSFRLS